MRKSFLTIGFLLGLIAPAMAQVNTVPQVGVQSGIIKQVTYSAVATGLAPASSATDVFCIGGSSTKSISIKRVRISGTAGTLVTIPVTILRRASLDTGGTAATGAALPVAAPNMAADPAATAVLVSYTANPTIVDTSPTYFSTQTLTLPTTAAGTSSSQIVWEYGELVGTFAKALDLVRGTTTTQYCINLNAVSVSSGLLNINMTWVEN